MSETQELITEAVDFYLRNSYIFCENYGEYIVCDETLCFRKKL